MARHPNATWDLPDNMTWDIVNIAVLMDIRDEMQKLNRIFHCSNFLEIPHILRTIKRNTNKPRRRKK